MTYRDIKQKVGTNKSNITDFKIPCFPPVIDLRLWSGLSENGIVPIASGYAHDECWFYLFAKTFSKICSTRFQNRSFLNPDEHPYSDHFLIGKLLVIDIFR